MQDTPRLLRTRAAAKYCGYAKSTMEKLRCFGGGPRFIRRGKAVYYDVDDLDEWIASMPRYSSTSEADATKGTEAHVP